MSSAAEAELGALYINGRKTIEERNILEEMGHPQPPTPIQTDNSLHQQEGAAKTHEGDGHAIPLAPRPRRQPTPIQILLETQLPQLRGLLDKTPPSRPSQEHEERIPYPSP